MAEAQSWRPRNDQNVALPLGSLRPSQQGLSVQRLGKETRPELCSWGGEVEVVYWKAVNGEVLDVVAS